MKHEASEFAVGDALQADVLLLSHHFGNGFVFDLSQLFRADIAIGALRSGVHDSLGPKEAAHVVCSERRPVAHVVSLLVRDDLPRLTPGI